jgi:DNA-binding LytR/AlgR family response regulator
MWVEGFKDYLKIHLKSSSRPVVARITMKSIEEQLPASMFIRVQKSFIVSKEYITAIRKNSVFINDMEIPVGDNYKEAVTALTGKH